MTLNPGAAEGFERLHLDARDFGLRFGWIVRSGDRPPNANRERQMLPRWVREHGREQYCTLIDTVFSKRPRAEPDVTALMLASRVDVASWSGAYALTTQDRGYAGSVDVLQVRQ